MIYFLAWRRRWPSSWSWLRSPSPSPPPPTTTPSAACWCFLPRRSRTRAHCPAQVTPECGLYLDSVFHEFVIGFIMITIMCSICIFMKILNSPIQWLQWVIYGATQQAPMMVYEQATPPHESYNVTLSINAAACESKDMVTQLLSMSILLLSYCHILPLLMPWGRHLSK
jgi:hypothetical protein